MKHEISYKNYILLSALGIACGLLVFGLPLKVEAVEVTPEIITEETIPEQSEDQEPKEPEKTDQQIEIEKAWQKLEQTDNSTIEYRVNALELRLQELGITLDDLIVRVEELGEDENLLEQLVTSINEQNNLVLTALNNLINNQNYQIENTPIEAYEAVVTIAESVKELNLNTVSGNSLVSGLDQRMTESQEQTAEQHKENMESMNYALVAVLLFLGIVIGAVFALILSRYMKNGNS
ncbi:MAG: hypothetical protein MR817_12490 [Lachnospiraceae bacterium]|nr:hypothetical protein [Lachnospiraceae bacterium]